VAVVNHAASELPTKWKQYIQKITEKTRYFVIHPRLLKIEYFYKTFYLLRYYWAMAFADRTALGLSLSMRLNGSGARAAGSVRQKCRLYFGYFVPIIYYLYALFTL
jgi:hypothetical protein